MLLYRDPKKDPLARREISAVKPNDTRDSKYYILLLFCFFSNLTQNNHGHVFEGSDRTLRRQGRAPKFMKHLFVLEHLVCSSVIGANGKEQDMQSSTNLCSGHISAST